MTIFRYADGFGCVRVRVKLVNNVHIRELAKINAHRCHLILHTVNMLSMEMNLS